MKRFATIVPILAVIAGAGLGAASGLYIKRMQLSSLALTGFRMGVPFLFLLPLMIRRRRLLGEPSRRKTLWIASAINAGRMLFFILAYKLNSVGNVIVLFYLWPVFAMLFDGLRLRRRPRPGQVALVALSFAGVVVMNLHRGLSLANADLLGALVPILAAALFAVTAILFKDALDTVHETEAIYFQNALGALAFLPFLAAELGGATVLDIELGFVYGASVGLVGFGLLFFAMKRLPLFQYSALAYCEVPIAVAFGIFLLGEKLVLNQVVGALMVVVASFLAQRARSG
ncbi:MAG: DMT family transporter, partial [Spirochaetota bacterium]